MTDGESGSAVPLLLAGLVVAAALVIQVGRLGAHAVAQARAEAAADAAALAAADALALGEGEEAAIDRAVATAHANGAGLDPGDCTCSGRMVTVQVSLRFRPVAGVVATARARARAEIRPPLGQFAR